MLNYAFFGCWMIAVCVWGSSPPPEVVDVIISYLSNIILKEMDLFSSRIFQNDDPFFVSFTAALMHQYWRQIKMGLAFSCTKNYFKLNLIHTLFTLNSHKQKLKTCRAKPLIVPSNIADPSFKILWTITFDDLMKLICLDRLGTNKSFWRGHRISFSCSVQKSGRCSPKP